MTTCEKAYLHGRSWSLTDGPERSVESWWDEDGFWYGLHTLLDPVRIPYFRAALENHLNKGSRGLVLDLGSGGGFVALALADLGEVIAVDHSIDAVSEAKTAGVGSVVVGDVSQLPFRDKTYEAVVCSEVLEHVPHPTATIVEAARVMKPDSLFLFSTPSRTLWSRLALIKVAQDWSLTRVLPRDLHSWSDFLTPSELTAVLRKAGFSTPVICGVGVKLSDFMSSAFALIRLKVGQLTYAEAGRAVGLKVIGSTRLAMIGCARRGESSDR